MSEKSFEIRGGAKLEAILKQLEKKAEHAGVLAVGFLENATYPDGTSVATVASVQEFGSPSKKIPSKPFFRNAIRINSPEWGVTLAAIVKVYNYDTTAALTVMGERIKAQIQESIHKGPFVPLKPITVKRKGFATPLIDSAVMLRSVDYEIEEGEL